LEIKDQPRQLLNSVAGLELVEMADSSVCCGFGGTFCVKFPDVSNKMVENKAANIAETGAAMVVAGDLGCLMNISGKLQRQGIGIQSRHVVEVLAGMVDEPAIGEPK
jgi:L-lactate dehydrogenase complex protein LldE